MTQTPREDLRIITYHTTHQAMAAEEVLHDAAIQFEVVPAPEEVSAGCGLAHRLREEDLDAAVAALQEAGAEYDRVVVPTGGYRRGQNRFGRKRMVE